jgi:DNA-binding response OmpR family regulator
MNDSPAPKKILIIDDDRSIVSVLTFLLKGTGYDVISASSGEEGLDWLGVARPDLIILDITMGGIDGFEFCELVKKYGTFQDIPVIFLSAKDTMGHINQAFELGAADYLVKPVDHRKLIATVQKYLPSAELQAEA